MANRHFFLPSVILSVAALLASCANVSSPTGGPKDTIPPELIKSQPLHESVRFQGDRVSLEFDERIALENLKNSLIVTPGLEEEFKDYLRTF